MTQGTQTGASDDARSQTGLETVGVAQAFFEGVRRRSQLLDRSFQRGYVDVGVGVSCDSDVVGLVSYVGDGESAETELRVGPQDGLVTCRSGGASGE